MIIFIILNYQENKINKNINDDKTEKFCTYNISNTSQNNRCFLSLDNSNLKIVHFILTRFMVKFFHRNEFPKRLYDKDYIPNGIRVLKKYLLPSLENQSCKNFSWIIILGDEANITYIKSLFNFKLSFKYEIIYNKDIKKYIRNIAKNNDILITTRIDYDDMIYYDAVNDVRKAININKPMVIYGYCRGFVYFELNGKYYDYYTGNNNKGASILA